MTETNPNQRLEAFCDGIFAIAITLLILDIRVPAIELIHSSGDLGHSLLTNWPSWLAFLLSFMSMFIAWVNHHHFIIQLNKSSNIFIYANGFFLLTVIIYPFVTALLAQYLNTPYAKFPVAIYCFFTTIHGCAWVLIFQCALHPKDLTKNEATKKNVIGGRKGTIYSVFYNIAMCVLSFWYPMVAVILSAVAWLAYMIMGIVLSPIE